MTSSAFEARRSALNGSIAAELIRSLLEVPTYVLGPVALYLRPPLSTQPSLFPMTVDDELLLPMPLREYLFFAEQRLTGVGFDAPVRGVSRQHLNVEGYASLLEQRHDGALAIIYAARMTNSRHVNATVLLHSGFSDGTILATTNSQLPSRMGGSMQAQGHTQIMTRFVDYHQNPQAASDAPPSLLDEAP